MDEIDVILKRKGEAGRGIATAAVDVQDMLEHEPIFTCPETKKVLETSSEYRKYAKSIGNDGIDAIVGRGVEKMVELINSEGAAVGHIDCILILDDIGEGRGASEIEALTSPLIMDEFSNNNNSMMSGGPSVSNNVSQFQSSQYFPNNPQASAAAADIEMMRREFDVWRHKEELAWHEKLREKEAASMRALEEKARNWGKEKAEVVIAAQAEYQKLEARLKKVLGEVEARERKLRKDEDIRIQEHSRKLAESQVLLKRAREEANHKVELEKVNTKAAVARADAAEKATKDMKKRATQAEEDFYEYRQQQRKNPESVLLQEIVTLKAQMSDSAAKINGMKAERNAALLEKEQFRAHIHRLARALKRERQKTAIAAQRDLEQLRLEYVAREQRFVMDGDRGELAKIKSELRALNDTEVVQGTRMGEGGDLRVQVEDEGEESYQSEYSPERYSPSRKGRGGEDSSRQTPPEKGRKNSPIKGGLGADVIEAEMKRLEEERKELIATGIFDGDHPIIKELDSRLNMKLVELSNTQ